MSRTNVNCTYPPRCRILKASNFLFVTGERFTIHRICTESLLSAPN